MIGGMDAYVISKRELDERCFTEVGHCGSCCHTTVVSVDSHIVVIDEG